MPSLTVAWSSPAKQRRKRPGSASVPMPGAPGVRISPASRHLRAMAASTAQASSLWCRNAPSEEEEEEEWRRSRRQNWPAQGSWTTVRSCSSSVAAALRQAAARRARSWGTQTSASQAWSSRRAAMASWHGTAAFAKTLRTARTRWSLAFRDSTQPVRNPDSARSLDAEYTTCTRSSSSRSRALVKGSFPKTDSAKTSSTTTSKPFERASSTVARSSASPVTVPSGFCGFDSSNARALFSSSIARSRSATVGSAPRTPPA
mmetsp:Transcript_8805/g.27079  ORF Transcript_8805/g.27079 Transcript_8805/m.27079 type:complete len:260 (+) Transcript_8805:92-871(+)